MNNNILIIAIAVVVCFIAKQITDLVKKKVPSETLESVSCTVDTILDKAQIIIKFADAYVAWAKEFKAEESGERKMELVIEKLAEAATKFDIDLSEDDLKAIAQKAYNDMNNK